MKFVTLFKLLVINYILASALCEKSHISRGVPQPVSIFSRIAQLSHTANDLKNHPHENKSNHKNPYRFKQSIFDNIIKTETNSIFDNINTNNEANSKNVTVVPAAVTHNKDNFTQILNEKIKLVSELVKNSNDKIKSEKQKIKELKSNLYHINMKTEKIEDELEQNKKMNKIQKNLLTDQSIIDNYLIHFSQLESKMDSLLNEVTDLEKNVPQYKFSKKYLSESNKLKTKLANIDKFNIKNLISDEAQIENLKMVRNIIQTENNFKIIVKNKSYSILDLLYYHNLFKRISQKCGKKMECLTSVKEEQEKLEKENLIWSSLQSITLHLNSLNH